MNIVDVVLLIAGAVAATIFNKEYTYYKNHYNNDKLVRYALLLGAAMGILLGILSPYAVDFIATLF